MYTETTHTHRRTHVYRDSTLTHACALAYMSELSENCDQGGQTSPHQLNLTVSFWLAGTTVVRGNTTCQSTPGLATTAPGFVRRDFRPLSGRPLLPLTMPGQKIILPKGQHYWKAVNPGFFFKLINLSSDRVKGGGNWRRIPQQRAQCPRCLMNCRGCLPWSVLSSDQTWLPVAIFPEIIGFTESIEWNEITEVYWV